MKPVGRAVGWMAVCATMVTGFEGVSLVAYPDKLARGLPTVCAGETEGVKLGDHYTKQECSDMLAAKLPRYWKEIAKCIRVPVSDNEKIAYTDFAYNVGSAGFCRSTTARKLNAGDHAGACNALMAWNRTKSKGVVAGLTRRREAERKICLTPDSATASLQGHAAEIHKSVIATAAAEKKPAPAPKPKPRLFSWAWWTQ